MRSSRHMIAALGALAALSAVGGAAPLQMESVGDIYEPRARRSRYRPKFPPGFNGHKPAGSKLARKAARGKL